MNHPTPTASRPAVRFGRSRLAAVALVAALVGSGTACSTAASDLAVAEAPVATAADPSTAAGAVARDEVPDTSVAHRAVVTAPTLEVRDRPGGDVLATLTDRTDFGSARVLLVEDQQDGWVRVRLPVRPNGQTGWVPATSVTLEPVGASVEISLDERTLTLLQDGRPVLVTPVAIGSDDNPTPTGRFFVTDKLESPEPGGAYGPYAVGLSGYSDTLTEFAGGNGQIGLHGTNDPGSIGEAVSHGCIRVPNSVISELAQRLPLGTPVTIVDDRADREA